MSDEMDLPASAPKSTPHIRDCTPRSIMPLRPGALWPLRPPHPPHPFESHPRACPGRPPLSTIHHRGIALDAHAC